nr:DNA methyltransferase [Brachybacterium timonense]
MRNLESELKRRMVTLAEEKGLPVPPGPLPYYPLSGLHGMDILPVAVLIARITLWMGHRQMIETHGPAEDPLPLAELSNLRRADALRSAWPATDVIIGNPPFIGDRTIRRKLGDDYVEWLKKTFRVGVIDLSGYWFRRAAEQMEPGQRAGLVSTNTLRENKHRQGSLDYVVQRGGVITDAVSSQKWPGDAQVHVSITNWVMSPEDPPTEFTLDGEPVSGITTQLREGRAGWQPKRLAANKGRSFIGCQPTGDGFLLGADEAQKLLEDPRNAGRVRPYLTSRDLANSVDSAPTRWIIDFGTMPLEDAASSPALLDIVRLRVRPEREQAGGDLARLWWQLWRPRPAMRTAIADLDRYIVCTLTGKRFFTAWQTGLTCPSNAVGVIAADDDFTMGVLSSRAHDAWAWWWSSTMKSDLRYTPTSTFQTFPFPTAPSSRARDRVAEASRELHERRSALSRERGIGLTALYNLYDDGAFEDLHDRHRELDEAVATAYGWPVTIAQDGDELVARLSALNEQIITGEVDYSPWGP